MRNNFIRSIVVWILAFACLQGCLSNGASVRFDWDDDNLPPVDSWTVEVQSAAGTVAYPGVTARPYLIQGLEPGVEYSLSVFGIRDGWRSNSSDVLTWRTDPVKFTPPVVGSTTNFVLTGILTGSVTKYTAGLKWGLATAPGNTNVIGYRVRVSTAGVLLSEASTSVSTIQIPGLTASEPYDITVLAIDRYGGSTSNAVPVRLKHTALQAGRVQTYQTVFQVP